MVIWVRRRRLRVWVCDRLLLADFCFIQDVQIMNPLALLNRLIAWQALLLLTIFKIADIQTFLLVTLSAIGNFLFLISLHLRDYMQDVLIIKLVITAVKSSKRIFSLVEYWITVFIYKTLELCVKVKLAVAALMTSASLTPFFLLRHPMRILCISLKLLLVRYCWGVVLNDGGFFLIGGKVEVKHRFLLLFACSCRKNLL